MSKKIKRAALLGSLVASLCAVAQPASAQWSVSGIGVAEYDTEETMLLLGGISATPGTPGWSPLIGIQTYMLRYQLPTETKTVYSVRPYAGLQKSYSAGAMSLTAGYATVTDDAGPRPIGSAAADNQNGVVLSGALDHWGSGGPFGYQLLGSYNFGGESLWTRGRVSRRVRSLANGGQVRVGGEVAYASSGDFSMTQPGLVAEWHNGRGFILGFGVGQKFIANADDATFFRVETVLPLFKRK